jgi:multiple sugar transport system substrate-binding protein
MSFLYNEEMLKKAGIAAPPQTWDEVTEQALKIKKAGLSEYPVMLALANESWLIEFLSAMVFSHGRRFADDKLERHRSCFFSPLVASRTSGAILRPPTT